MSLVRAVEDNSQLLELEVPSSTAHESGASGREQAVDASRSEMPEAALELTACHCPALPR